MNQIEQVEFVMFVGIPASGKSTMAQEYKDKGYAILSSDELRAFTEREIDENRLVLPSNTNLNAFVFEQLKKDALSLIKSGRNVVIDATNLGRRRRMNFIKSLKRNPCKKTCVLFIAPVDVCIERNAKREGYARVPDEAMYKMFCNFECPNFWEGWDEIVPVCHQQRYEFDFSLIENFSQDNPYHKLTLDGHMAQTVKLATEKGYSDVVIKVAHFHDIGKYYTKRFENRKGEKTEKAHFYGHENYGAYLYLVQSCCGREFSKQDFETILYEVNLINCHMRPLTVWRECDKVKEKDKKLFGEQFFDDLLKLNECDRLAH